MSLAKTSLIPGIVMENKIKSFYFPPNLKPEERFKYTFERLNEQPAVKKLMKELSNK